MVDPVRRMRRARRTIQGRRGTARRTIRAGPRRRCARCARGGDREPGGLTPTSPPRGEVRLRADRAAPPAW
jgi:hypothetical protein